jgi:transposase-like protein
MPRSVNGASLGFWRERLATPKYATRTDKELGAMFGVHASTVQYWRRKVSNSQQSEAAPAKSSSNFLPVFVRPASTMDSVVVRLPGDVSISVPCDATSALVTVLNQLRQAT